MPLEYSVKCILFQIHLWFYFTICLKFWRVVSYCIVNVKQTWQNNFSWCMQCTLLNILGASTKETSKLPGKPFFNDYNSRVSILPYWWWQLPLYGLWMFLYCGSLSLGIYHLNDKQKKIIFLSGWSSNDLCCKKYMSQNFSSSSIS